MTEILYLFVIGVLLAYGIQNELLRRRVWDLSQDNSTLHSRVESLEEDIGQLKRSNSQGGNSELRRRDDFVSMQGAELAARCLQDER